MFWVIPLSALIIFELIADILAKNWSVKGGWWIGGMALAAYLVGNFFWLFALKHGSGLGKGAIIFSLASAIIAVLLGYFLYHEEITRNESIGIVLGLVALIFIFWE
jgi:drug/metabolite transporter (DMT)-like permease